MQGVNGLENKRVVVIGGSSGIGFAVARQATSQGAKVVIASSNGQRVQEAVNRASRRDFLCKAWGVRSPGVHRRGQPAATRTRQ
jgi:NAD(P)-dependent dehydrogenase (short-subunit alcohol dehydrogenase family)